MARHTFNFEGGEDLTTMGATWFVSYKYYELIDRNHVNWNKVKTSKSRSSVYNRTTTMHNYWLTKVLEMDNYNLNKNTIGLDAEQVKSLTRLILSKYK